MGQPLMHFTISHLTSLSRMHVNIKRYCGVGVIYTALIYLNEEWRCIDFNLAECCSGMP